MDSIGSNKILKSKIKENTYFKNNMFALSESERSYFKEKDILSDEF